MAFLDSTTAVIDAILTRKGRELLAKNDGSFQITKFAFGDDEVNYQLFDATRATDQDSDILNLPVLEPVSNENVALLYRLVTLPEGTLKISTLNITPTTATVDFGSDLQITVATDNGQDPQGYAATSRDLDIARLQNTTSIPDENGVGAFVIQTGALAGGKDGTTIIDVTGINSGARKEVTVNVSASGATV
tara:strand:+ start:673 stop:1245 length:573 start_codon:yes stop_codon:yes gene_type:complete